MLTYAGQEFEDMRVTHESLTPERKIELGLVDWGQLPALVVDGEVKCQSHAIYRYLANKFNLAGKNEWEKFRCDEISEANRDLFMKIYPLFGARKDAEKLEQLKKKFAEEDAPPFLEKFNKILEKNEHGWFVGDSMTYVDILFVNSIGYQTAFDLHITKAYPAIERLIGAVENHPKLKDWIANRPKTEL